MVHAANQAEVEEEVTLEVMTAVLPMVEEIKVPTPVVDSMTATKETITAKEIMGIVEVTTTETLEMRSKQPMI